MLFRSTSSHQTKAPSPDAASANAVAAPATPSKNIVFSENTRRRSFSDAPPDIDLSANFPGEPPPRSSGDVPLWPLVPIGLLSAGGYTVARRQKTLEAHDEPEEAEPPSKGERFLAGAVVAGFAGAALYYTAASAVLLAPAAMRALSGGGQQAIRIAQSQSGKVDLNRAGRVALDTNAIIARLEGAPADVIAVVQALGSRNPVVSRMAVREFVRGGGDMNKLREFLRQSGGGLGKAPSQQTVDELLRLGLKPADARVVGSAIEEGIPIMTRDDKILRKMGEAAERF